MIAPEICFSCLNRLRDVCQPCTKEGRFRYLEAEPLGYGETPPDLPSMRQVVDMPPYHRLALLWLHLKLRELQDTTT